MDAQAGARFGGWLKAIGIETRRRVSRNDADSIVVSKFEPGFAARLHDALARVPELFDDALIAERSRCTAPGTPRVEAWRMAVDGCLREAVLAGAIDPPQGGEIQAGVDSVAALLDSVLWTRPVVGSRWRVSVSEREAYSDARRRMDDQPGLFTRYYGEFEGLRVENHCPGAKVARQLLAQAWMVCTDQV